MHHATLLQEEVWRPAQGVGLQLGGFQVGTRTAQLPARVRCLPLQAGHVRAVRRRGRFRGRSGVLTHAAPRRSHLLFLLCQIAKSSKVRITHPCCAHVVPRRGHLALLWTPASRAHQLGPVRDASCRPMHSNFVLSRQGSAATACSRGTPGGSVCQWHRISGLRRLVTSPQQQTSLKKIQSRLGARLHHNPTHSEGQESPAACFNRQDTSAGHTRRRETACSCASRLDTRCCAWRVDARSASSARLASSKRCSARSARASAAAAACCSRSACCSACHATV